MSLFSAFAVYFIIWWLTLFMVLPIGVRSQAESGEIEPGTDPGAPVKANLGWKLLANTVLSALVFGIWYYVTQIAGVDFTAISSKLFGR